MQLCFIMSNTVMGQVSIDRKIIIDQGQYYYCSIDNETQLATLYFGAAKQKLQQANHKQIPIGRAVEDPINPLCFDIQHNKLLGINWILNSNNSRYEAIKRIPLKELKPSRNTVEMLTASFEQETFASNEPWQKMLADTNVLFQCFFDLIQQHQRLVMAVCNQNKLRISFFENGVWKHHALIDFEPKGYCSLLFNGKALGIVDAQGNVYRYNELSNTLKKVVMGYNSNQLLIVDKDHNTLYTINQEAIAAAAQISLYTLIQQSAQPINY
jgi:hypothetical protein